MNFNENISIEENIINEGIDFIAIASTQWHAVCVDSAIYSLKERLNKKPCGIILVSRYGANFRISKDDFSAEEFSEIKFITIGDEEKSLFERVFSFFKDHVKLLFKIRNIRKYSEKSVTNENLRKSLTNNKKTQNDDFSSLKTNYSKKNLFLISPVAPFNRLLLYFNKEISKKYKAVFICDDGGLGAYMPKSFTKASNEASKDSSSLKLFIMEKGLSFDKKIRNSYIPYVEVVRRNLFVIGTYKEQKLIPNKEILESYKSVLKIRNYNKNIAKKINKKSVLIITQPYSEMGFVNDLDEFKVINQVVSYLKNKKINIILKPHPRESSRKYEKLEKDVTILDNSFSIEEILPSLDLFSVIGFTSSALINAKIFYNIPSISLADLICKYSNDEALLFSSKELKKLTNDFIIFLDDVEQINL